MSGLPAALPLPFNPYAPSEELTLAENLKTTEVPATMSASVRQASATTPDPISQYLRFKAAVSSDEVRALLDIERTAPIGLSAQVLEAKLLLYLAGVWPAGTHSISLKAIDEPWDAASATWTDKPSTRPATVTFSVTGGQADGTLIEVDITALVATSVSADDASGARWYGVEISTTATSELKFYSAFAAPETRPKMRIKYNLPPDAPSDLLPNGGRAVSEVRPEFVWRFNDPDAGDTLSFVQVQIATADDFASTTYDSTKVAYTAPRFDMGSPPSGSAAVSDLAPNTTYYWRAKQWDSHNLESDWSSAAEFEVRIKNTLTLLTPATSSVSSPTPTISWALSAGTQAQWQVEIERKVAGVWLTHWDQGWSVGTTTSVTVPDDYALVEGEEYRVIVRVKDTIDREDMAGDRSFYEDSQEVTLAGLSV